MTRACPECDGTDYRVRKDDSMFFSPHRVGQERYRCRECGARFDELVERESRAPMKPERGLPRELLEADPEEWP